MAKGSWRNRHGGFAIGPPGELGDRVELSPAGPDRPEVRGDVPVEVIA